MEQKKRRRKKCQSGKPMAVDSCKLVNSEKSSADMVQLAHKYMKCRVESSTDSESDANTEVLLNSSFPGGVLKKTTYKKLQFLDPYEGDYEETSGTSDCSVASLADACPGKGISPKHPVPEGLTVEENFPPESLSTSPYWGVSATHKTTKPRDNLMFMEIATEDDGKGLSSRLSREAESCTTESFCFTQHNPSVCSQFSGNKAPTSVLWSTVRLSDERAHEDPIKRKQGQPMVECAGKKLRAT
ncbi:uncharacterized protein LOC132588746 isoform X2 [Heteronotia binoei]|uniref:uncharacterized protein LOC132588746 isoform X2 n=1 Tax=Heteronotia binoei TaxID=13085 RepID=UPI00292E77AB|nr:uncharacterized protein LOC132588746 isoform X2 [Heteronotia binoei]